MSMCRVFSCGVGRGCLLWPVHFLGKTLLVFALLHSAVQGTLKSLLQHHSSKAPILHSQRWTSSIQSVKTKLGADNGSDHELLMVKFRLKLKKVGKTTRPFTYELNQIPHDYTVEVRNRFKGLDLIDYLMNYGRRFMTLCRRQGSRPSPWKRNAKKQNGCLGRAYK